MRTDAIHGKFLLSFGSPLALAVFGLFTLSTSLKAAPLPQRSPSALASLAAYQTELPSLQQQIQQACANGRTDESRAQAASAAYQHANEIRARIQADIQVRQNFLKAPNASIQNAYRAQAAGRAQKARDDLRSALDQYAGDQADYRAGKIGRAAYLKSREALKTAEDRDETAGQLPPPAFIGKVVADQVAATSSELNPLQVAAQNLTLLATRADGCYATASGSGTPADPSYGEAPVVTRPAATDSSATAPGASGGNAR